MEFDQVGLLVRKIIVGHRTFELIRTLLDNVTDLDVLIEPNFFNAIVLLAEALVAFISDHGVADLYVFSAGIANGWLFHRVE